MSETDIAFLSCPTDLDNPGPAVNLLLQMPHAGMTGTSLFIAAAGKFKAAAKVQTLNVAANYPAEFARLLTLTRWAVPGPTLSAQFHHSQVLMCLRQFVRTYPSFGRVVLLYSATADHEVCDQLLGSEQSGAFTWLLPTEERPQADGPGLIVMNRGYPGADDALDLALDIALSGAIYGLDPYSFTGFLDHVMSSLPLAISSRGFVQ